MKGVVPRPPSYTQKGDSVGKYYCFSWKKSRLAKYKHNEENTGTWANISISLTCVIFYIYRFGDMLPLFFYINWEDIQYTLLIYNSSTTLLCPHGLRRNIYQVSAFTLGFPQYLFVSLPNKFYQKQTGLSSNLIVKLFRSSTKFSIQPMNLAGKWQDVELNSWSSRASTK